MYRVIVDFTVLKNKSANICFVFNNPFLKKFDVCVLYKEKISINCIKIIKKKILSFLSKTTIPHMISLHVTPDGLLSELWAQMEENSKVFILSGNYKISF